MEYFDKIVNIIYRLPCITFFWWTWLCRASAKNLGSVSENAHNSWTPWYIHFKFCILMYFNPLSSHCHAKRWRGFAEHHFGRSSSISEKAHNSWTPWYNHFKFCTLMYFNIVQPLPCKTMTRLCRASFWPVKLIIKYQLRVDKASSSIILAGRALLVKMLITLEPHIVYLLQILYIYVF